MANEYIDLSCRGRVSILLKATLQKYSDVSCLYRNTLRPPYPIPCCDLLQTH